MLPQKAVFAVPVVVVSATAFSGVKLSGVVSFWSLASQSVPGVVWPSGVVGVGPASKGAPDVLPELLLVVEPPSVLPPLLVEPLLLAVPLLVSPPELDVLSSSSPELPDEDDDVLGLPASGVVAPLLSSDDEHA